MTLKEKQNKDSHEIYTMQRRDIRKPFKCSFLPNLPSRFSVAINVIVGRPSIWRQLFARNANWFVKLLANSDGSRDV